MSWLTQNFLSAFLLPPFNLILLGGTGLLLLRNHPRLGRKLISASLALLYLFSTPIVAGFLLGLLEPPPLSEPARSAGAIVVLGGGTYFQAPEYGSDTVSADALERLRYAAYLQRKTGKPVLVTGGSPEGSTPEGELMKETLERDFGTAVRWTEDASRNTDENARFSYRILKPAGVTTIYVVTHAWHMARAKRAFERAGFHVIPAATGFVTHPPLTVLDFLPRAGGLAKSYSAMHEAIGLVWYWLKAQ